jgi:hypothetical protein
MKLRALIMLLVILMTSGVGVVAAQKFMPEQPDIDLADSESWKQLIFGVGDRAAERKDGLIVLERMVRKDEIVRGLVEGEITLEQAAQRFFEINKDNKPYFIGIECNFPNADFQEVIYRSVLDWAEGKYGKLTGFPSIRHALEVQFKDCRQKGFPLPPMPTQSTSTAG